MLLAHLKGVLGDGDSTAFDHQLGEVIALSALYRVHAAELASRALDIELASVIARLDDKNRRTMNEELSRIRADYFLMSHERGKKSPAIDVEATTKLLDGLKAIFKGRAPSVDATTPTRKNPAAP